MLIVAKVEKPTILSHTRKGSNPQTAPLSKTANIAHHRQNFATDSGEGDRLRKSRHELASCKRFTRFNPKVVGASPSMPLALASGR